MKKLSTSVDFSELFIHKKQVNGPEEAFLNLLINFFKILLNLIIVT